MTNDIHVDTRQFQKYQMNAFLLTSKMQHFRCFGNYKFWTNLNIQYWPVSNVVKNTIKTNMFDQIWYM